MTEKPQCTATSQRSGKRCEKTPMKGQTICASHGGKAKQNLAAAERRQQEQEARKAVVTYGLSQEIEPHKALLEELYRTRGHVCWLEQWIQDSNDIDLHQTVGGGEFSQPRQVPSVWLELYQSERKHYAQLAIACIRAGIEERRIKLAEDQGALLARVINGILVDLGVADNPDAPKIVRKHLQLVAGGEA